MWGDHEIRYVNILGYSNVSTTGRMMLEGAMAHTPKPVTPYYWPNSVAKKVNAVFSEMPKDWEMVIRLRYRERCTHKVIAKRLGCHPNTVNNKLNEVRGWLKPRLDFIVGKT